jgi:hypothetical protein
MMVMKSSRRYITNYCFIALHTSVSYQKEWASSMVKIINKTLILCLNIDLSWLKEIINEKRGDNNEPKWL